MIGAFLWLKDIYSGFDQAEELLEKTIQAPTCLPNCGICCMCNVPQSMTIEGINAVSRLTGSGRLKKILSIAEGWLLERHSFLKIYEGMPVGWATPQLRDEWLTISKSQCPFLDETKRCLLHDCRPITCRAYGVTRDAADICPRLPGRGESESQRVYIPADSLREDIKAFREDCEEKNKAWIISGLFPTTLYRAAEPDKFRQYVLDNKIASAKLIGVEIDASLIWQPQVQAIRRGESLDLVAEMR